MNLFSLREKVGMKGKNKSPLPLRERGRVRGDIMFFVERASPAYLLAVPRTAGGFLSLVRPRERNQREGRPDGATTPLRFSAELALAPTRRAQTTRLGLKHEARFSRFRLRCSARHTGAGKHHPGFVRRSARDDGIPLQG